MTVESPPLTADSHADADRRPARRWDFQRLVRVTGFVTVILSLTTACVTFLILMGMTWIKPDQEVVFWAVIVNGVLVITLICNVGWQIGTLLVARRRGRAAARLHIRIVTLFSVIAILPALLLAAVASITLDRGLDTWFSQRTKSIVENSVQIAQAFLAAQVEELHRVVASVKTDIERARPLLLQDVDRFQEYVSQISHTRDLPGLFLVSGDRSIMAQGDVGSQSLFPPPPPAAIDKAKADPANPVLIPPGPASFMADVQKLANYDDLYVYVVRAVDPKILGYIATTNQSLEEYRGLEAARFNLQIAFGLLFLGVTLVILVSAIWLGISLANRLVSPIRRLIDAAGAVSQGDLEVRVPTKGSDGDLAALGETFNIMTKQLGAQRRDLISANQDAESRRRFSEAVLAGVTAGVVGIDREARVTIVNRTALRLLGNQSGLLGMRVDDLLPELAPIVASSLRDRRPEHRDQITINRGGRQRMLNVRVTSEGTGAELQGYVITLDDITDLVAAQRSSAWADVARRIAHEIKNPLTPIQLSAERLRRRFGKVITEGKEIFDQCTETIIRQVGDIGRMVDEFSSFARMPKPAFEIGNLSSSIREAVFLIEVAHPDIVFRTVLPEEPLIVRFDTRLMGQVITNLVKNATEAIAALPPAEREKTGGLITVAGALTSDSIVVDVIDNGIGLPTENRHRLLEPYMTTREKGTGLGLAIVSKIVEEHGGRVELLDAPEVADGGHGAMMRITLPRADVAQAPVGPAAEVPTKSAVAV
ncbi:MAG TPA: PAS domain-containing sensor histidine kinase [Bauldia sp.]|nr:PAS domain-containing sensor histidine kinase [Bauldia sp.]